MNETGVDDYMDAQDKRITELEKENERLSDQVKELGAQLSWWQDAGPIIEDSERYKAACDESIDTIEIRVWVGSEDNGGWEYPRSKDECDRAIDEAREVE